MADNSSMPNGVEDAAYMSMHAALTVFCVPLALRAAIKLNVLEILSAENAELSSKEIVARMKAKGELSISNPAADVALDRILRVIASQGILSSSIQEPEGEVTRYGLNAQSRHLVGTPSMAAFSLIAFHKAFTDAWPFLEQAVIAGGEPFALAHDGKNPFAYAQDEDAEFRSLFNTAMAQQTMLFIPFLLESYDGFLGVNTLVDVGGGVGACSNAIVSKYPHISAINFDQPHVVAAAPSYNIGVEHVGGDMFESIPQADAIFMKWILHDWSDDLCVKILKNCYTALPPNGKVIIVDAILSPEVETTSRARINYNVDLFMFVYFHGGKERTKKQLQEIANAAGFKKLQIVTQINEFFVIELHKV